MIEERARDPVGSLAQAYTTILIFLLATFFSFSFSLKISNSI